MNRFALCATLLLATMAGVARADDHADFTARYAALKVALATRDPAVIKPLLTKDYINKGPRGEATADEMIEDLKAMPGGPGGPGAGPDSETVIDSLTVTGDSATVAQHFHTGGTRTGRDGAQHSFDITAASDDVWVRADGKWLLRSSTTRKMVLKRDGEELFNYGQ